MAKIDFSDRSQVLAIIGQGYVGLPLAMAAVDAGWSVIGIEKSVSRVALARLRIYLTRDWLRRYMKRNSLPQAIHQIFRLRQL